MTKEQEWIFYERAAWNLDKATHVVRLLMDSNRPDFSYEERRIRCAALDFSVISYCSPFLSFDIGGNQRIKGLVKEDFVSSEFSEIHDQIRTYRDKEIAHTDISHLSSPGFDNGDRIIFSKTHTSLPSIANCFSLFDSVRAEVTEKFAKLDKEGVQQQSGI